MKRSSARIIKIKLLTLFSVISFIFLFIGGPDYYSSRSHQHAWDCGHILFFAVWTNLLLISWKSISNTSYLRQCFRILLISLVFAAAVEIAQGWFGRTSNIDDLIKDMTGSMITLAFISSQRKTIKRKKLIIFQLAVAVLIIFEIAPLAMALKDENIAKKQFPMLGDFETLFEKSRWTSQAPIARDNRIAISGNYSLRVPLATTEYSGVFLKHFPGDWTGYNFIQFSIFNKSTGELNIHCLVNDKHTSSDQGYNDRFNSTHSLTNGWNSIKISFEKVMNAPDSRKIDMENIKEFGIFVAGLKRPETIYIDNVRMTQ